MSVVAKILICEADFQEEPIRHRLRRRLLALSYHAFARCLCLLLARLGYEDARPAGRTRWKGHNREGGYDIETWLPVGITRRRVVVQAKQFDARPVFQRSVDELRGTCLRAGAAEALLITTSAFSSVVQQHQAQAGPQVAPVRLLDGEELTDLLVRHRLGVREEAETSPGGPRRLEIDQSFFDRLDRQYAGRSSTGKRQGVAPPREPGAELPRWLVTIRVGPPDLTQGDGGSERPGGGRRAG